MSNHLIRFLIELAPLVLRGQPVVAPSPEVSTGVRPSEWGGYKVTSSFETGYRFSTVGGDYDLYRSNVNYGNGLRLLGSSFTANSTEGRGLLFDSLNVNAQGLGNDPYGIASVRLEKNERYRYDMLWRRSDYYNPFLNNGGSRNLANTRRNMQDQDLNLKAVSWMKVRLGYSRNQEDGPVVSSYELFIGGLDRSVLPILKGVRRDWNEYRVGADVDFWGFRLSVTRQWDFYKDDTPLAALAAGQAYPLANTSVASQYRRAEPMHGRTPAGSGTWGQTADAGR